MPLISVIVPIYNADKYLHKCLNSLLSQTVNDFEVILIDDGSTDSSGSICDDYVRQDKRFIVVHKNNEGLSAARNDGIALAKGEWITFLDSDDWLSSPFFEVLFDNQDNEFIITSYRKWYSNDTSYIETFEKQSIGLNFLFKEDNYKVGLFTAWGKFYKTSIIKNYNLLFDPKISPGEDTLFNFHYLLYVDRVFVSNTVCYNWLDSNGLTNRKRSLDCMMYTIDNTMNALNLLESKINIELPIIKYNNIIYLLSRIDIRNSKYMDLYKSICELSPKNYIRDMINDISYIQKGKRRKLVDVLFKKRAYFILTMWIKFTNRFYS